MTILRELVNPLPNHLLVYVCVVCVLYNHNFIPSPSSPIFIMDFWILPFFFLSNTVTQRGSWMLECPQCYFIVLRRHKVCVWEVEINKNDHGKMIWNKTHEQNFGSIEWRHSVENGTAEEMLKQQ